MDKAACLHLVSFSSGFFPSRGESHPTMSPPASTPKGSTTHHVRDKNGVALAPLLQPHPSFNHFQPDQKRSFTPYH